MDTKWVTKSPITASHCPLLTDALKHSPRQNPSMRGIIFELEQLGIYFNTPGDPFENISKIRLMLNDIDKPQQQLMPVLLPPCGNPECGRLQGDLQYEKDPFSGQYSPQKTPCARCGHGGLLMAEYLPQEFYVRLQGLRFGDLDTSNLPSFPNYRLNGLIQYSKQHKHFRTIRVYGELALLMDGPSCSII